LSALTIPTVIVVVYVVVLLAIGFVAARLARRGGESFFLAGRQLPALLVAVTVTGLAVGGASTIGVAQNAFEGQGLAAGWYGVAWSISALVVGLVVSGRYRRLGVVTVPQLFESRYDRKGLTACVVVQVLVQIVITSLQYVAGGAILNQLLPEVFPTVAAGMVFSAIVFVALTMAGGLWSASLSNILNVTLICLGVALAAALSLRATGGWERLAGSLPSDKDYFHPVAGFGWSNIVIFTLVLVTCNVSFQATVQIAFAARDANAARRGFVLAALLMLPIGFLAALIGVAARANYPDLTEAATALPRMVSSRHLHPLAAGVTLAALWAADVSTACGLLLSSATIIVRDILPRRLVRVQDQASLLVNRLVVLMIGAVTLVLALQIEGILNALMKGLSLMTGPTVVVLFTFFAPRLCRVSSAFWTISAGVLVAAVWLAMPAWQERLHVIYVAWVVCLTVFLIVSIFDTRSIRESPVPEDMARPFNKVG
jgi:SSS family solute:Na+ symporter